MNELVITTDIVQDLKVNLSIETAYKAVAELEKKYAGVIITPGQEKEARKILSELNKLITGLKGTRIDFVKRVKQQYEPQVEELKQFEDRVEILKNNIWIQVKESEEKELKEQYDLMVDIKVTLCREQKIDDKLLEYIILPEQKGELTRSKFNEKKATELIQIEIDRVVKDYQILVSAVDTTNTKSGTNLKVDDYIKYIDNMARALQEIMADESKYLRMQEEIAEKERQKAEAEMKAKLEEETAKIQEQATISKTETTQSQSHIDSIQAKNEGWAIQVLVRFKKDEKPKAKALRVFLDDNNINYEKI